MATSYSTILTRSGARSFTSAGLIARFPMSMVGISTILAVEELYGSYTAAGLVSAASFVAMAVGAPILARCVDRFGQSRIMLPAIVISSTSLAGLVAAASAHMRLGVLTVLATLAGGLTGSMGSLVRARWTAMLTRPEDVHAAFSLEAALDEVAFILGPVLATALCTTSVLPVTSGWLTCLAMQLVGGLWFLSQRATEPAAHPHRPQQAAHDSADHRPVLRYGAVVAAAVVFLLLGAMFGANDVAAVAFATEAGPKSASGLVLAVWGGGVLRRSAPLRLAHLGMAVVEAAAGGDDGTGRGHVDLLAGAEPRGAVGAGPADGAGHRPDPDQRQQHRAGDGGPLPAH